MPTAKGPRRLKLDNPDFLRPDRKKTILAILVFLILLLVISSRGRILFLQRSDAAGRLAAGVEDYRRGYFEDARYELDFVLSSRFGPARTGRYWSILGRANVALGRTSEAAIAFERAVGAEPGNVEYRYMLALSYVGLGRAGEATPHLREALKRWPGQNAARMLMARVMSDEGKPEEAIGHYKTLMTRSPDARTASNIHTLLATLVAGEDKQEGARLLQLALKLDPNNEKAKWLLIKYTGYDTSYVHEKISAKQALRTKITAPHSGKLITARVFTVKGRAYSLSDDVKLVEVSIDGGLTWYEAQLSEARNNWSARVRPPLLKNERLSIVSRARNADDEYEAITSRVEVVIDNAPVEVELETRPARPTSGDGWFVTPPTVYLFADEPLGSVYYRWDDRDYHVYESALKAPVGEHVLTYFSRDERGEAGTIKRMRVKVKIADVQ